MQERSRGAVRQTVRRVVIADGQQLLRLGMIALINAEPDLAVCGEASTIVAAKNLIQSEAPDVAVIDLVFDDGNGLDLARYLQTLTPAPRVLICATPGEVGFAPRAIRAGADGYLEKKHAHTQLVRAIRSVLDAGVWLSRDMMIRILDVIARNRILPERHPLEALSERELTVFDLIGRGMGPSQIAIKLSRSVKTVESHRENIKRKLHLLSGNELRQAAMLWVRGSGMAGQSDIVRIRPRRARVP